MTEGNGVSGHRVTGEVREDFAFDRTEVRANALGELQGRDVVVERSAIRTLEASDATVSQSAIGVLSVERGTVRKSGVGIVVGKGVACDEVRTGILAAPVVRGEVHTWLDLRTAVAIGLGMALGRAMLGAIGYLVRRLLR